MLPVANSSVFSVGFEQETTSGGGLYYFVGSQSDGLHLDRTLVAAKMMPRLGFEKLSIIFETVRTLLNKTVREPEHGKFNARSALCFHRRNIEQLIHR
jgi:hypothetical protein